MVLSLLGVWHGPIRLGSVPDPSEKLGQPIALRLVHRNFPLIDAGGKGGDEVSGGGGKAG